MEKTALTDPDLQEIMEIDRKFFESHPDLNEYVRPIFPFEKTESVLNGVIHANSVLVKKVAEGVRVRIPFTSNSSIHFVRKRKKSRGFGAA